VQRRGKRVRDAIHLAWTTGWVVAVYGRKSRELGVRRKAFRIVSSTVPNLFGASAVLIVRVNASSSAVVHESERFLGLASR